MNYLNIHIDNLMSEEFLGAEPIDRATWLCLLRYCAQHETGGIIEGATWGERKWMQLCGITENEVRRECKLWKWKDGKIIVNMYPIEQEKAIKKQRKAGKKYGRGMPNKRINKASKGNSLSNSSPNSSPDSLPDSLPDSSTIDNRNRNSNSNRKRKKEGKKEGEKEGEKEKIPRDFQEKESKKVAENTPQKNAEGSDAKDAPQENAGNDATGDATGKRGSIAAEVNEVMQVWNDTMKDTAIPSVRKLTKGRHQKIVTRLQDDEFQNNYEEIFRKVTESHFLCGENNRGWTATLDWIIDNDTNYVKVWEGAHMKKTAKKKEDDNDDFFND